MVKCLLSIAGFDPSGGAGILLDVRLFERLGFGACGVLTAVTAQSPARTYRAKALPAPMITAQFRGLKRSLDFAGIKVGMIGSRENVRAVAKILAENEGIPRVIDPVFKASSGLRLLDRRAEPGFLKAVAAKAELITPNIEEASVLAGRPIKTARDARDAARMIYDSSRIPCLVKGGHLRGPAVDVLYNGSSFKEFEHPRFKKSVHGTGCFLSSAILAYLAAGCGLESACRRGILLTVRAIHEAVPAGHGRSVFVF